VKAQLYFPSFFSLFHPHPSFSSWFLPSFFLGSHLLRSLHSLFIFLPSFFFFFFLLSSHHTRAMVMVQKGTAALLGDGTGHG
jgi:hypothetical protein